MKSRGEIDLKIKEYKAQNLTNEAIAARLGMSESGVVKAWARIRKETGEAKVPPGRRPVDGKHKKKNGGGK